jgi:hypothetical protein
MNCLEHEDASSKSDGMTAWLQARDDSMTSAGVADLRRRPLAGTVRESSRAAVLRCARTGKDRKDRKPTVSQRQPQGSTLQFRGWSSPSQWTTLARPERPAPGEHVADTEDEVVPEPAPAIVPRRGRSPSQRRRYRLPRSQFDHHVSTARRSTWAICDSIRATAPAANGPSSGAGRTPSYVCDAAMY